MPTKVLAVDGARQLRAALKRAGADVQDLKEAHAKVARLVADRARPATPHRTGRLGRDVRPGATRAAAVVKAGRKAIPYAGPIHFGWPARGIQAQPWITEAAEASQGAWEDVYLAALDQIIHTIEGTTS
jgi:hypothetical protein